MVAEEEEAIYIASTYYIMSDPDPIARSGASCAAVSHLNYILSNTSELESYLKLTCGGDLAVFWAAFLRRFLQHFCGVFAAFSRRFRGVFAAFSRRFGSVLEAVTSGN